MKAIVEPFVMGMERLAFGWHPQTTNWLALIGYLARTLVYLAQFALSGQ